jgi:hypothetical protein
LSSRPRPEDELPAVTELADKPQTGDTGDDEGCADFGMSWDGGSGTKALLQSGHIVNS